MQIQKSYLNNRPCLYLVATPIGNLKEMSPRSIDILRSVNYIACEDTRTSYPLLKHFKIEAKTLSYHNFNEEHSSKGLIRLLKQGNDIAVISDAGYPLISDPGYRIVNECIKEDINVVTISGPSAGLHALIASGLDTKHYLFYGFMQKAKKELELIKDFPYTIIFYEAPHRILDTLKIMYDILGNRKAVIARELTKHYEEYIRFNLNEYEHIDELKGEIVVLVEGRKEDIPLDVDIKAYINGLIEEGISTKDAIKQASKELKRPKNEIYHIYHE